MPAESDNNKADPGNRKPDGASPENEAGEKPRSREIGGRPGPEPTRYGDWEKAGRCIDF